MGSDSGWGNDNGPKRKVVYKFDLVEFHTGAV